MSLCASLNEKTTKIQRPNFRIVCLLKEKHSTKKVYSVEFDCIEGASRQQIVYILF